MGKIKIKLSDRERQSALEHYAPVNDYLGVKSISRREIDFLEIKPKALTVQISLVEYFERVKRHQADRWQKDFCRRLQSAAERRHLDRYWAIFHAEGQLGKTSIKSQVFPAWLLGHDPLFRFALAMYNVSRSQTHSQVVLQILESNIHKDIFPRKEGHLTCEVSKAGWMTNARRELNDGQLSFNPVGLQSGLTGSGFDWLSIDDPYKESKEAFSETVRENMKNFWDYTVMSRVSPYSSVTGMFHRYAPEDFAGFLLDSGDFEYVRYATQADGDYIHEATGQRFPDPLGRKEGEYISPERRPPSYYEKPRKNSRVWLSMFQGRPSAEEGEFFSVGKIEYISPDDAQERRRECVALVRAWDNAATDEAGAYTVGALMGIRANGKITVFDVVRERLDSAKRLQKQKETAAADGIDVPVRIPQDPASAGKDTAWFTEQFLEGFTVVSRLASGSKEMRAMNYSSAVNAGDVEFVLDDDLPENKQWNKEAKKELRDFPLSEYKDIVDAMSDGYNYLYEVFRKGLVIHNYRPQRNLVAYSDFARRFPFYNSQNELILKIPADFRIYAGLKISSEASKPSSGVIVARASHGSNLPEALFVVAEYKAYESNFYRLFEWLASSLETYCQKPKTALIWLHKDSAQFAETIRRKLRYNVQVFEEDGFAGITEMNWYLLPTEKAHPFNQGERSAGLYFLVNDAQFDCPSDAQGFYSARQEIKTWGFDEKGEPSPVGGVMDCLRMMAFQFKTRPAPLTFEEQVQRELERRMPAAPVESQAEVSPEVAQMEYTRKFLLEREIREKLRNQYSPCPAWRDIG